VRANEGQSWPLNVGTEGAVAAGSLLWRNDGKLHLTVVVKAAFVIQHGGPMALAQAPTLESREHHRNDDPTQSLLWASDIVPHKPRTDVWLNGHACAPAGRPSSVVVTRLALFRNQTALLDKSLNVYGDRISFDDPPRPFDRIPIVYERSFGGVDDDENPVGVGGDERPLVPNIVDPSDPGRAVGYGPISRYWRVRRRDVTPAVRRRLEGRIAEIPEHFDWSYYQASPHDQRIDELCGDEWLVLEGMHPTLLRIQTRLPKVRALARIADTQHPDGHAVALRADTLAVDVDRGRCMLTWRGSIAFDDEESLATMRAGAAIEFPGAPPVDWAAVLERSEDDLFEDPSIDTTLDDSDADGDVDIDDPLFDTAIDHGGEFGRTLPSVLRGMRRAKPDDGTTDHIVKTVRAPIATTSDRTSQAVDTVPGCGSTDEDTEWNAGPSPASGQPTRAELLSQPPAPLDLERYAESLRAAGATGAEVTAAVEAIRAAKLPPQP